MADLPSEIIFPPHVAVEPVRSVTVAVDTTGIVGGSSFLQPKLKATDNNNKDRCYVFIFDRIRLLPVSSHWCNIDFTNCQNIIKG
jgi:hypothetical protein